MVWFWLLGRCWDGLIWYLGNVEMVWFDTWEMLRWYGYDSWETLRWFDLILGRRWDGLIWYLGDVEMVWFDTWEMLRWYGYDTWEMLRWFGFEYLGDVKMLLDDVGGVEIPCCWDPLFTTFCPLQFAKSPKSMRVVTNESRTSQTRMVHADSRRLVLCNAGKEMHCALLHFISFSFHIGCIQWMSNSRKMLVRVRTKFSLQITSGNFHRTIQNTLSEYCRYYMKR